MEYRIGLYDTIIRTKDNACIPKDDGNIDYQVFLEWNAKQEFPLNLIYEPNTEEIKAKANAEIYAKFKEIDERSIRAMRDNDLIYIEKYRAESEMLRAQILK